MKEFSREQYDRLMTALLKSFVADEEVEAIMYVIKSISPLQNIVGEQSEKPTESLTVAAVSHQVKREFIRRHKARYVQYEEMYYIWADSFHNEPYTDDHTYLVQARKLLNTAIFTIETVFYTESHDRYPALLMGLARMYQIKAIFRGLISLEEPRLAKDKTGQVKVVAKYSTRRQDRDKVNGNQISEAIRDYFSLILIPLSSHLDIVPDEQATQRLSRRKPKVRVVDDSTEKTSSSRLFPNSKDVNVSIAFQVPQFIADGVNRTIQRFSNADPKADWKQNRKPVLRVQGPTAGAQTELHLDADQLRIKTADAAAEQLLRVRNAKVIQTFFALWKYATLKDSVRFWDTPISDVMGLALKAANKTNFNSKARREFSDILNYLSSVTLTVSYVTERVSAKGKSKPVLRENRGVRLFKMEAEYAIKKQFQSLPKSELNDEHFDKEVITRFSGQLIPDNEALLKERGHIYFDSLLHFDANKDSKAIILGFAIQTRFNQLSDKEKFLSWDRGSIIDLCDYGKTNSQKPSMATELISKALNKLKASNIISGYQGLTHKDSDIIRIYPPGANKESLKS